jgi:hypothetical protein
MFSGMIRAAGAAAVRDDCADMALRVMKVGTEIRIFGDPILT